MRARGPGRKGSLLPLCHHPTAYPASVGLEGRGGSGIWVSVAWVLAMLGVCAVSVVASASVQGPHTAAGDVFRRPWELPLSSFPEICEGVRGDILVVSALATVPYPALHQGAAWAGRQSMHFGQWSAVWTDFGQWSAVHIPRCVMAFGAAYNCRQAEPFTRDARR